MTEDEEPVRTSLVAYETKLRRLHKPLSYAPADAFMGMIWAAEALQDGRGDAARVVFPSFPPQALAPDKEDSPLRIHKWELETLTYHFLMATPGRRVGGRRRELVCTTIDTLTRLVNALRAFEDAEGGRYLSSDNILMEMSRLVQKQFPWQRGSFNKSNFYRTAFIYGQGECLEYFKTEYGITPNDLSGVGFALFSSAANKPVFAGKIDLNRVGITDDAVSKAIPMLAANVETLRGRANATYVRGQASPYQVSPLRQYPVVVTELGLIVPIRELLTMRITSGLYYDLVGANGAVLREIGSRYEEYVGSVLKGSLSSLKVTPEFKYKLGKRELDTPDFLLQNGDGVRAIIECKSTKMTVSAQYSPTPLLGAKRGIEELSKGVFQIWRFCSHVRRGLVPNTSSSTPIGLVATLDYWAMMSPEVYTAILDGAVALSQADAGIKQEDRISFLICPIDDVEAVLLQTSDENFVETLRAATSSEFTGWLLPYVMRRVGLNFGEPKKHPLINKLSEVLPWARAVGLGS